MARRGKSSGGNGWIWAIALVLLFTGGLGRLLAVLGIGILLLLGLIAAAVFFATKSDGKQQGGERKTAETVSGKSSEHIVDMPEIDPEDQAILTQARRDVTELKIAAGRVGFAEIRTAANEAGLTIEKLLNVLRQQPEDIRGAQLFLQYSVPKARDILKKYVQMETSGVATPETTYKVLAYLREVKNAANKTLNGVFADDVADIDAELEVLRQSYDEMGI